MRETAAGSGVPIAVIIADDLTGAADTAAGFALEGLTTVVRWPEAPGQMGAVDAEVLALDLGTRAGEGSHARVHAGTFVDAIRKAGIATVYKKCDSLLRGHIGAEVAGAISAWHPGSLAIAALAFPDAGRTTVDGLQHISGRDVALPIAPLFERAGLRTHGVGLDTIRADGLDRELRRAHADRADVVVCDAVSNADLAAIVDGGLALPTPIVWVGTGGLARALARAIGSAGAERMRQGVRDAARLTRVGPILIVCGSRSDIAREQVKRVVDAGAVLVEVPAAVLEAEAERGDRRRIADLIGSSLAQRRDVVVTLARPAGEPGEECALRVAAELGRMLAPFADRVGGVAATGGDTATAVLRAWGATSLRLTGEVEPGIAVAVASGRHQFAVVTKAGAFGGPDALLRARSRLHMMIHEATGIA